MGDLRSDAVFSNPQPRKVKEEPEPVELGLFQHGHDQDPDEQSILEAAVIAQRKREADALLGGLRR